MTGRARVNRVWDWVRPMREIGAMGIDWMTKDELNEAIPPAYTEHIGRFLLEQLEAVAA